jgi:hypothetical protein
MLQVRLRLLSDGFSCAAVEPSTAIINILDGGMWIKMKKVR